MTPFAGIPHCHPAASAVGCRPLRGDLADTARGPVAAVASLVLALATGLPLRSVARLVPEAGEEAGPYVGV